jgi:hypothetical protein
VTREAIDRFRFGHEAEATFDGTERETRTSGAVDR